MTNKFTVIKVINVTPLLKMSSSKLSVRVNKDNMDTSYLSVSLTRKDIHKLRKVDEKEDVHE